jgi:hypothetical protein
MNRGDAREESYYHCLKDLLDAFASASGIPKSEVSILPKTTEAGNPDFRVWDGKNHITGYIEAKKPETYSLDPIATSPQLKRYLGTFPNLLLTNFYEFRLYQHGAFISSVCIASPINATQMRTTPPLEHVEEFAALLSRYYSFSLPAIEDPKSLANALAKRTRFLRDEVIAIELAEEEKQGRKVLLGFYESFKKLLINNLTLEQFADLYAQTLTYGIFAARTRSEGEFNRELIHKYIPNTLGILKSIFKFISYEEPPQALIVLIDDIAEILYITDIKKILHAYYVEGKGSDPIIHFYETFLCEYDPSLREKRGVYYTPEPVVRYIVRSIHSILKSHFGASDGLASPQVTILDPAAGTLTFPAEAIKTAIQEHSSKYGSGNLHKLIKEHILPHFHAIELMMAPYTVGHLKISYLLAEYGYEMADDERFKLYLSNTLEKDSPQVVSYHIAEDINHECLLANKIKHDDPILVIMGNPPYSGASENSNDWTEKLLKTDLDGAQSYYTVDGKPLGELNPKMLQDDYVKFIRFAQWKIQKAGKGIVGMITNHSYIDNATFRGMRQSLLATFDQIYVLDLHGNSTKKEKCPDGSKDENVFDIRTGVAILVMIKNSMMKKTTCYSELYGLRQFKYDYLMTNEMKSTDSEEIHPSDPFYLLKPFDDRNTEYSDWLSLVDIFPKNSAGIKTARDELTIQDSIELVGKTIHHFASLDIDTARIAYRLGEDSRDWKIKLAQQDLIGSGINDTNILPILYRPFDIRFTYYTGKSRGFHSMPRHEVMKNMLKDNVGLILGRQGQAVGITEAWNLAFVSETLVDNNIYYRGGGVLLPLYLSYKDANEMEETQTHSINICPVVLEKLQTMGVSETDFFYYVYAILYSNTYRSRYSEYLKYDFPRVPICMTKSHLLQLSELGNQLADLHLMRSPLLNPPLARYQGSGANDMVESVVYDAASATVRINPDKYFEGVTDALWNYHIGGYQVLHKYLKDRKGKVLSDPIHYCRMVTALALTIDIQSRIDSIIEPVLVPDAVIAKDTP